LTIIDDDSVKVRFTQQDALFGSTLSRLPRFEESESTSSAIIQVELSAPSSERISVSYATSNVDALAGEDYISASGTLTFEPGQQQRIFTVSIIEDSLPEADEVLILNLSNAVGAIIETPDAQLVIRDND